MHEMQMDRWTHRHTFGTQEVPRGESRTRWVIGLTVVMMVVEIAAGWAFGSMALLADGLHMASHAVALGITAFARLEDRDGAVNAFGGEAMAWADVRAHVHNAWPNGRPVRHGGHSVGMR